MQRSALVSREKQPRDTQPRHWLARARVWFSRLPLDRRIAQGADPDSNAALAVRAEQLLRAKFRLRLARDLQLLIDESRQGPPHWSAAAPFEYRDVLAAEGAFGEVIATLRGPDEVGARGVAMLTTLLSDAASPLYAPGAGDLLGPYLELARRHLLERQR